MKHRKNSVLKNISKESIRINKKRNILVIIVLSLAATLLSSIFLYGFGVSQSKINHVKDTAQIVLHAIPTEQGMQLEQEKDISWIGEFLQIGAKKIKNSLLYIQYANQEMVDSQNIDYVGKIPQKENEILVQRAFLEKIGLEKKIGDTISMPVTKEINEDFIISGIIDTDMGDIGSYTAIISKKYVEKNIKGNVLLDYYIGLNNASEMSEEDATTYSEKLINRFNLSEEQVVVRSDYFETMNQKLFNSDMILYAFVGLLTLVGAGIVVYSIFYIFVSEKIRFYGQLRTIGTTRKQIFSIVYYDGKLLCVVGIPIGLIIGNIIGYLAIPEGWSLKNALIVTFITGLFVLLIASISIWKPARKASLISPLEALRHNIYKGKYKESRKLKRKITSISLGFFYLFREKKRTVLTIMSLSVGGILMMIFSTLMFSYDGAAETRAKAFPFGEFQIVLNEDSMENNLAELQNKNFFNEEFLNEVENIEGVSDLKQWKSLDALCVVNGSEVNNVQGFSKSEVTKLEEGLIEGTVDYNKLVKGNGIILLKDRADDGYCSANLGDTVNIIYTDENGNKTEMETTVMGIVSNYPYAGKKKCFTMPDKLLDQIAQADTTEIIEIKVEGSKEEVKDRLEELISSNPDLIINTFEEKMNYYISIQQMMNGLLFVISICIAFFSLINLISTTISNFISRKKEFGILQTVGLSRQQLYTMLMFEGGMYTICSAVFTAIFGKIFGYICCMFLKSANGYYYYEFPVAIILAYCVIVFLSYIGILTFMIYDLKKDTLIEQVSIEE